MIGSVLNWSMRADGAHRLVAVHDRHHDVHQDDVDVGRVARAAASASAPLSATVTSAWPRSSSAVMREDVAEVVVDDEDLAPSIERSSAVVPVAVGCGADSPARRRGDGLGGRAVGCASASASAGRGVGGSPAGRKTVKVLPSPGVLATRDLAAEQADELAADREPEAGAAVEAGGGAVALRERLEDPLLLLVLDADAGVADRERDDRRGAAERRRCSRLQPLSARPICTCTVPRSVNLNALASRFFRIWRRRCGSVTMTVGAVGATSIEKPRPFASRDVLELAHEVVAELARSATSVISAVDRARLDLGEVEDAVEQLEQLVARRVDDARVLDLRRRSCCGRGCPRAARRGSAGCSAACAARATCSR